MGFELFGQTRIESIPGFLEGGEGVGIHHLGPHVAVIARRIPVAREDMGEMGRGVAHPDGPRHADPRQRVRLGRQRICGGRAVVEIQIDERRGHVFDRLEPHVVGLGRQQPVEHVLRHRLARFHMAGVGFQHLRNLQPVFV